MEMDAAKIRKMESDAREIGKLIGDAIEQRGQKNGFALMIFSFDGPEFTYISNAQRGDMIKTMKELIQRLECGEAAQTWSERN
jgi:hypothetical protein